MNQPYSDFLHLYNNLDIDFGPENKKKTYLTRYILWLKVFLVDSIEQTKLLWNRCSCKFSGHSFCTKQKCTKKSFFDLGYGSFFLYQAEIYKKELFFYFN